MVGVDHQGQHGAVHAGGRLHHVRHVALALDVVEEGQVLAGRLLMRAEIEVAPRRDPLELRPAEWKFVLDVEGAAGVMRQLILVMLA